MLVLEERTKMTSGRAFEMDLQQMGCMGLKHMGAQFGCGCEGAGCGEKWSRRRKHMISRQLSPRFTGFHPDFTPRFTPNMLIVKQLYKMTVGKRQINAEFGVRNAKFQPRTNTNKHGLFLTKHAKSAKESPCQKSKVGRFSSSAGSRAVVPGKIGRYWRISKPKILLYFCGKIMFVWYIPPLAIGLF
jgi:hypothetical protein